MIEQHGNFCHCVDGVRCLTGGSSTANRPHIPFNRKPDWVRDELIRLKAKMPNAGCRTLAITFNRIVAARCWRNDARFHGGAGAVSTMKVSKGFVAQVVRKHRYAIEALRRRMKHRVPHPQPTNAVWGIDLTGKQDAYGHQHNILGIIDHGSRFRLTKPMVWSRPATCSPTGERMKRSGCADTNTRYPGLFVFLRCPKN